MSMKSREHYSSPNGDRWLLCHDTDTQRVFIKHEPNARSGGHVSEMAVGTFLSRGPLNPEHQALLRLITTLTDGDVHTTVPRERAPHLDRAYESIIREAEPRTLHRL